jgi:adenosylhomocysteine nucleosidase
MIALTFALPDESRAFVKRLSAIRRTRHHGLPVVCGKLGGGEIMVCHTGVGADSTRTAVDFLLNHHRPRMLVSSGFAGALQPGLEIGDLVIAGNFSAPALLDKARILFHPDAPVHFGALITRAAPAETVADKGSLARATGALAVDMETEWIARGCAEAGVEMIAMRGISDTATQPLPVPFARWFDVQKQKPRPGALLGHLARHPGLIPDFARFVRGVFFTKTVLAEYLEKWIRAV